MFFFRGAKFSAKFVLVNYLLFSLIFPLFAESVKPPENLDTGRSPSLAHVAYVYSLERKVIYFLLEDVS